MASLTEVRRLNGRSHVVVILTRGTWKCSTIVDRFLTVFAIATARFVSQQPIVEWRKELTLRIGPHCVETFLLVKETSPPLLVNSWSAHVCYAKVHLLIHV